MKAIPGLQERKTPSEGDHTKEKSGGEKEGFTVLPAHTPKKHFWSRLKRKKGRHPLILLGRENHAAEGVDRGRRKKKRACSGPKTPHHAKDKAPDHNAPHVAKRVERKKGEAADAPQRRPHVEKLRKGAFYTGKVFRRKGRRDVYKTKRQKEHQ